MGPLAAIANIKCLDPRFSSFAIIVLFPYTPSLFASPLHPKVGFFFPVTMIHLMIFIFLSLVSLFILISLAWGQFTQAILCHCIFFSSVLYHDQERKFVVLLSSYLL